MIIEMKIGATAEELSAIIARVEELGFETQVNKGEQRTVIGVFGSKTGQLDTGNFEVMSGVEQVVRMTKPYKLSSRLSRCNNYCQQLRRSFS